jgi:hypothetical protein
MNKTYEIEKKYLFNSVSEARGWMASTRFSWKRIGIIQWYVDVPFNTDRSSRIRYQAEYEGTRLIERWIYGKKTVINGDLEKRIEEEKEFLPATVTEDLPFLDPIIIRKIETGNLDAFPAIQKMRYRMESRELHLPESEIVMDFFLYPEYLKESTVILEVELKNTGITTDTDSLFGIISYSLSFSSICEEVTRNRNYTNHALARNASEMGIPPLNATLAIEITKRFLSE